MISSEVLAAMEYRARHCGNIGRCSNQDWGNIPIILLVGDDYQLPSVKDGMFHSMEQQYFQNILHKQYNKNKRADVLYGEQLFLQFANDVMCLKIVKRQKPTDVKFMDLLEKTRCENIHNQMTKKVPNIYANFIFDKHIFQLHNVTSFLMILKQCFSLL